MATSIRTTRRREIFLSAVLRLHARCYRDLKFAVRVRMYAEAKDVPAERIPFGNEVDVWNAAAEFVAWKAGTWRRPRWLGRERSARPRPADAHLLPMEGSFGPAGAPSR